jgi:cation diffusion facilitator family transporter
MRMAVWGLVASTLLGAVKILAGVLGHAYALVADGVESITDVFSSLVVLGGLRIAAIPPDEKHPYGHGKAETLAALAVAVALLGTAAGIAVQSLREIVTDTERLPRHLPKPFTLVVLIAAILTKEVMFRLMDRAGREIDSRAVKNEAWHHRSDALTSGAAFVGISIALVGGPNYAVADAWAALFACAVVAANGIRLLRTALDDMMDSAAPVEVETKVRDLAAATPGVVAIEKCRVRRSGLSLIVDIHVEVDGDLSVRRGHEIAHDVKQTLLDSQLSILDVTVHIEPADHARTV